MSHYAKVNNGIVEKVIVAEADFFDSFVTPCDIFVTFL